MKFYIKNTTTVVISGIIDTGHHQSDKGEYRSFYLEYQALDNDGSLTGASPMYHRIMVSKQEDSEFGKMAVALNILREDGMADLDDLLGLVIEIGQTFPEGSRYPVFKIVRPLGYYKTAEECNGFVTFEIESLSVKTAENLASLPPYVRRRILESVEVQESPYCEDIIQIMGA